MLGTILSSTQTMLVEKREQAVCGSTRAWLAEASMCHLGSLNRKLWLSELSYVQHA